MTYKAYRSRKSGRYFRFVEYCDDGYGKYEDRDSIEDNEIAFYQEDHQAHYQFKGHSTEDVEAVFFHVTELRTECVEARRGI